MTKLRLLIITMLALLVSTQSYGDKIYTKFGCTAAVVMDMAGSQNYREESELASDMIFDYLMRYQKPFGITSEAEYHYYFFGFPEGCDQKVEILNKAIQFYKDFSEKPLKYIYVVEEISKMPEYLAGDHYDFITEIEVENKRYKPEECIASLEILETGKLTLQRSDEFIELATDYLYDNERSYSLNSFSKEKFYFLFHSANGCDNKERFLEEAIESYQLLADDPFQKFHMVTSGIEAGEDTITSNLRFFDE